MGGSTRVGVHRLSGLLHLCARCHDWVESHRDSAHQGGWLIGGDPRISPVWLHAALIWGGWWLLDDDGGYHWLDPEDPGTPERPDLPPWGTW